MDQGRSFLFQQLTTLFKGGQAVTNRQQSHGRDYERHGNLQQLSDDQYHVPFQAEGVPALLLAVEDGEYAVHHHAATDTLDKIDPRMLSLDTAVMASATYTFANSKEVAGRRLSAEEVHQYLKETGLADGFGILYGPGKP